MKDINELLTNGYDFNMGKYLGDGWEYYKKGAGNYIGFTIVFFVIVFMVAILPFVNLLTNIFEYTLVAGLYIYTRNMLKGNGDFPNFFHGFNSFGQIVLFTLVLIAFMVPAIIVAFLYIIPEGVFWALIQGDLRELEYIMEDFVYSLGENLGRIILIYLLILAYIAFLYISYSFTLILIVDRGMNFWDAMETSRKVIAKNFFSFLLMYILLGIMIGIGVIMTCGLGIFIGFPYSYLVVFAAYNDIIGPEVDELEENVNEFGSGSE